MESVVSMRYATALFDVGLEENSLDTLRAELVSVGEILSGNEAFYKLLAGPLVPKEEKVEMLQKVFGGNLSQNICNFLMILAEKNRFGYYADIVEDYQDLYDAHFGILKARATTAIPLSDANRQRLVAKLGEITGKTVVLESRVDPSILGGIVINMKDSQIDSSVRHRIETLRKQISTIIA